VPASTLAQLVSEAEVTAVHASTSIKGNPLSLTEVRRLLKSDPTHGRDSEKEVLNYNTALKALHAAPLAGLSEKRLLAIHAQVMADLLPAHQVSHYRQHPVVIHDPRSN
jgi:Fic family protein